MKKPVYWCTCEVTLAVFVVKNRDVLYYKQVRHNEIVKDKDHTHAYEDFFIPISTSTWDEMVRNVMKEYYPTF